MRYLSIVVFGAAAAALAAPAGAASSDYLLQLDGIGGLPPVLAKVSTMHPTKVEVPDTKVSPREAGSGLATGRRQHQPVIRKVVGDLDGDGALDVAETSKLDEAPALVFEAPTADEGALCGTTDHLRTGKLTAPDGAVYDLNTISVVCSGSDGALRTVALTGSMKHTKTGHVTLMK
jgi:hypothetical protein